MTGITTHTDSINGKEVELVLNAPYETIAAGNRLSRGNSVVSFCNRHSSNYAKVVGQQVWASPFKGCLLSAYIDKKLQVWGLDKSECKIYLPLDNSIYSIEVGGFGSCVLGSESIVSYEETLKVAQHGPLHVLSDGELTSKFDGAIEIDHSELLRDFTFKTIDRELLRNRFFVVKHYVATAACIALAFVGLSVVSSAVLNDKAPTVFETFQEIVTPTGTDIAVSQLRFIDEVLRNDMSYFFGKGLNRISYDTSEGITIEGSYPSARLLQQLIDDTENAGLTLLLSQNGWKITKRPEIELRPSFNLASFNDNYQTVKAVQERFGFSVATNAPTTNLERRLAKVELTKAINSLPRLSEIGQALTGRSVAVETLVITVRDYHYAHLSVTMTVSGDKS